MKRRHFLVETFDVYLCHDAEVWVKKIFEQNIYVTSLRFGLRKSLNKIFMFRR